jgi:hypothetical protein
MEVQTLNAQRVKWTSANNHTVEMLLDSIVPTPDFFLAECAILLVSKDLN